MRPEMENVVSYMPETTVQPKLCTVTWFLAIELPCFSKIMQTRYHSKELSEQNLILTRVVKSCSFKWF